MCGGAPATQTAALKLIRGTSQLTSPMSVEVPPSGNGAGGASAGIVSLIPFCGSPSEPWICLARSCDAAEYFGGPIASMFS